MTDILTPDEYERFINRVHDRPERIHPVEVARMGRDILIVRYHQDGLWERVSERLVTIVEGGGSDIILGEIHPTNLDLEKADRLVRDAERKAKECKHLKGHRVVDGFACSACEAFSDEPTMTRSCGSCGEFVPDELDERRCPTCNKFTSIEDRLTCPECNEQDTMRPAKAEECVTCRKALRVDLAG